MRTPPPPAAPHRAVPDPSATLTPMETPSSDRARVEGTSMASSSPIRRVSQALNLIADWLLPLVDLHLSNLDPDKATIAKMICKALAWVLAWGADQLERAAPAEPAPLTPSLATPEVSTAQDNQARR